jgi:hypothetical protein
MTSYALLFQLDLRHDYFGGVRMPVRLEAWGPTRDLLAGSGTRLLSNGPQIRVFAETDRTRLVEPAEGGMIEAWFALHPLNAEFLYVTAGLEVERGHVRVFDAMPVGPEGTCVSISTRTAAGGVRHVYEVSAPRGSPCWRFSDSGRKTYRIHTKKIE